MPMNGSKDRAWDGGQTMIRPLYECAAIIREDWKNMSPHAAPYVEAMDCLDTVDDFYGVERADGIVLYFLANAQSWRGEVARSMKAELKWMVSDV